MVSSIVGSWDHLRNRHLRCDERFVGYGGNKAACIFEMHLSGVDFYVLSEHFIVHQNHMYEEMTRKLEVGRKYSLPAAERNLYLRFLKRKHNRKLYTDFKEETCLRYVTYTVQIHHHAT